MNIVKMFHYFNGYYIVQINGYMMEKLLNVFHIHKIYAWDIKKDKNGTMQLKIMRGSLNKLISLSKNFKVEVKIISERGLPYFLKTLVRKKGFAVGCFLLFASFLFLSSLILKIEIPVEYSMNKEQIINSLNKAGLKHGRIKYIIDYDEVKRNFLIDNPDFTYISIEIQGTKAKVKLYSAIEPQQISDYSRPADIVAKRDGKIIKILAIRGTPVVKKGDTVKKGDVLISGKDHMIVGLSETDVYQRAAGNVEAKVEYNFKDIPINTLEPKKDCNFIKAKTITIGKLSFDFIDADNKSDLIEYKTIKKNLYFFDFRLPVCIENKTLYSKSDAEIKSESKITNDVIEYVRNNDLIEKNIQIININITITGQYQDSNLYSVKITCLEDIAQVKFLNVPAGDNQ